MFVFSTMTLPTSLRCLDEAGVRSTVSYYVLPIGTNINLDSAALVEPIVVMFAIRALGYKLDLSETILLK